MNVGRPATICGGWSYQRARHLYGMTVTAIFRFEKDSMIVIPVNLSAVTQRTLRWLADPIQMDRSVYPKES